MKNVFRKKKTEKQFEQSVSAVVRDFPAVVSHFSLLIFENEFFLLLRFFID